MVNYQLYCGDCLDIIPQLEIDKIKLVLADPPYGRTRNPWDKVIDIDRMWNCLSKVLPTTPIVLFSQLPFAADLIEGNKKNFRYEWVWQKTNPLGFLNANRMPLRCHENILVFYRSLPKYNPIMWKAETKGHHGGTGRETSNYGKFECLKNTPGNYMRYPLDVIKFSNADRSNQYHPTEKPVGLLEYLIKTYTDEGETILDFCMGSGSTGVASMNTGRNFVGIELNKEYFDAAKKRIEDVCTDKGL